ncbi:acyl carrier protein phosphodiesterase [Winogradskyella aurantia]|uniref:ACP phosphodiesterase n=1 Tax=Winogradskyella aurantia TaxID=1915063 RepID=A0A265UXC4_9FLAO|nr:acyl carrier protein phosphodiesterase [Winogradskyella aurantia]OZV69872.1 ACP phosphodiesterase [Winogradskyella aurantia]
MNFLAHIFLSGDNELLTIGNFVADGIRGKNYKTYPQEMQAGILLHRFIDTFTDAHPVFRQSTKRLHEPYGHYSGVIVDIFYDHFLAKNWKRYSTVELSIYVENFYNSLNKHLELLPPKFQHLTPVMIRGNWLLGYATIKGIQSVLNGMNRRTKYMSKMDKATAELKEHYDKFESEFLTFFDDLIRVSSDKRLQLEIEHNIA